MPEASILKNETFFTVSNVAVGIDTNSPSNQVTWATGRNVRFKPGYVFKTSGKRALASLNTSGLPIRDTFTFIGIDGAAHTIICTDAKVFAANSDFTKITDITPTVPPTGGVDNNWEFTLVDGLPIVTNGKDAIWKWPVLTSILTPLLNAPIAQNISCCMHMLVCSNIYNNGYYYAGRIMWSEPGNPENWTIDTTKRAGKFDLMNYEDGKDAVHNIIRQISNGSKTYFFTNHNLWVCDFSEANKKFYCIDNDIRILSPKLACIDKNTIYAMAVDDVWGYYNDVKKSIGMQTKNNISSVNFGNITSSFCFPMHSANEIWFCVPTDSNTSPDTAYIYNWELTQWTIQDCDFLSHSLYYGQPPKASSYITLYNNSGAVVTAKNNSGSIINLIGKITVYGSIPQDICGDSNSNILLMDMGYNALDTSLNAIPINGYIETGDIDLGNRAFEKIIEQLFPDFVQQNSGNDIYIQIGARNNLSLPLVWSPPCPFMIGSDFLADLRNYQGNAAYIRIRFYSNTLDSPWTLASFTTRIKKGRLIQ